VALKVLKWCFRHFLIGMIKTSFEISVHQVHVPTHSLELLCLNVRISAYSYGQCFEIPSVAGTYKTNKMQYFKKAGVLRL
jgi:hypothetical protein